MTKIIELRPDKSLINQNFEKYQFASDLVPVILEKDLARDVYRQEPGSNQESWLEARLFAFHNHLYKNPFDLSCWFVDENLDVWKFLRDGTLTKIHSLSKYDKEISISTCNPSIAFASIDIVILTNGSTTLEILIENSSESKQSFKMNDINPGVLMDARYIKDKSSIIVAMCCIKEVEGRKSSDLVLLSYNYKPEEQFIGNTLQLNRKQVLHVAGPIEYIHIEASGDKIHTISQDTASFEYDSLKLVEQKKKDILSNVENRIPKYCWSQEEDALTVWVTIPEKYHKEEPKINITSTTISIVVNHTVLIQGDLQHRLDPDLSTWKRDKDTLRLELGKHENGLMWSELIKQDAGGEYLPNETLAAEIHQRMSHLCTSDPQQDASEGQPVVGFNAEQLEECDLEGQANFLQRINLNTHATTHLVMLASSNHLLFTHKLKSGQALCLRHDHHGCVWLPKENESEDWELNHVGSFPGFGYVEASKTNKKFCISPPNGSYVAIIEHKRHAFLYEKAKDSEPIAKQRIVDLGSEATPIMGAIATNKNLILLTKNKLYQLEVYP